MKTNNTIDPDEIEKFNKLAGDWWDKQGKLRTLHDINPARLEFVTQHIALKDSTLLDVGCGGGIFSELLAQAGAKVTGIDLSKSAVRVAREHSQVNNLDILYQETSAESFAQDHPEHYDALVCMELLEHIPDPSSIIATCAQCVKPNGFLFFSTLNRNAKSFFQAIITAEYLLNILPKQTHHYDKFIKPSELAAWAREAELTVRSIKGLAYNPFTKKASLCDDISVNYLVCLQKR